MNAAVSLEQLLRAAQLLEQSQSMPLIDPLSFCKLGQDYEERFIQSKIRSNLIASTVAAPFDTTMSGGLATAAAAGNLFEPKLSIGSTGSSRRSSPSTLLSGASSAPSVSSQHSSAPNSPPVVLLPSNINAAAAAMATAKKSSSVVSPGGIAPLLTCRTANSSSSQSTRQSRAAHNELEKNRRANLRSYLDKLKSVLPADPESTRDTTLSLLTRARNYIRVMKRQKQSLLAVRSAALAENLRLQERLAALKNQQGVCVEAQPMDHVQQQQSAFEAQQQLVNLQLVDDSLPVRSEPAVIPDIHVQPAVQPQLLVKPEPQHVSQASPMYMEFSPSAKPTVAPVPEGLPPALTTLLPQLVAALQKQHQPVVNNELDVAASVAALLRAQTAASLLPTGGLNGLAAAPAPLAANPLMGNNLLYTPFRQTPIDLVNEGLLPALPLLYPYPYLDEQRQQLLQNPSANAC